MKLSQLNGPLPLTPLNIDSAVLRNRAGVYVLGYEIAAGFYVEKVGRSDRDLNLEIRKFVGKFACFKAAYCGSSEEAYAAECQLWHDFANRKHNPQHPVPPEGTRLRCPKGKQCFTHVVVPCGA